MSHSSLSLNLLASYAAGRGTYVPNADVRSSHPRAETHTRSLRTDTQHAERKSANQYRWQLSRRSGGTAALLWRAGANEGSKKKKKIAEWGMRMKKCWANKKEGRWESGEWKVSY